MEAWKSGGSYVYLICSDDDLDRKKSDPVARRTSLPGSDEEID
ncbi:MAG: hypothetical protein ABIH34_04370 [Nanoarchaeota archaeon]